MEDYIRSLGCGVCEGATPPQRLASARAGIVTLGKNNFAYDKDAGSFVCLSTIVIDTELEYDTPTITTDCPPNCRLCMDACPTKAILEPGHMNPKRCLSFNLWLTPDFPEELRPSAGCHVYGCDICQEVCPRNQKALNKPTHPDPFLEMLENEFDLEKMLLNDPEHYERVIRPLMFNYIRDPKMFQRNAAFALGNSGDPSHIPALEQAMQSDDPMVQEAAAWAIDRIHQLEAEKTE